MNGCGATEVLAAVRAVGRSVTSHRDELVELDRAIGDGDHGENLKRGFDAFAVATDGYVPESPSAVVQLLATTLISNVGGAAGPLYGTAFLRAAKILCAADSEPGSVDAGAVAAALRAAEGGVRARGKAEIGDKTMVDALGPAADAAQAACGEGAGVRAVLAAAARAADDGVAATRELVARKGRASYLGERAIGHVDPGARSTALILHALAEGG